MIDGVGRLGFLNGEFAPLDECRISPLDRGFIFGDAVYEVIPVHRGQPFALERHLDRLQQSLRKISLAAPYPMSKWRQYVEELIEKNALSSGSVYIQITRGEAPRNHAFPETQIPTSFAMVMHGAAPKMSTAPRIAAITAEDNRWGRCDIKTTALLANVLLKQSAVKQDAEEAILCRQGYVTEGSSSNVFLVKNSVVTTPPLSEHLLGGITRQCVIELLKSCQIEFDEIEISENSLQSADEIWITSSTRNISAVNRLDGKLVGDGETYPLVDEMYRRFFEYDFEAS